MKPPIPLLAALCLLLPASLSAQIAPIGSIDGEYLNKEAWGGRLFSTFTSSRRAPLAVRFSALSWSFVRDPRDQRVKLSMNPLWTALALPAAWGSPHGDSPGFLLFALFYLPQVIPNMTLEVPIVPDHTYFTVGQRTDYYLFNNVAHIYTEGFVGVRAVGGSSFPLSAEVRGVLPFTRGFLEDRKPYIGLALSLSFDAMRRKTR